MQHHLAVQKSIVHLYLNYHSIIWSLQVQRMQQIWESNIMKQDTKYHDKLDRLGWKITIL